MKASDLVENIKEWTMQAHAVELEDESILHLLDSEVVGAPLGLHETIEAFLANGKDGPVRLDPEELEELEDAIKKHSEKYV
jgi:hypothetical protein